MTKSPSAPAASPRARLLVVDDEPTICDFARELFQTEGFIVETASTGIDALKKAEASRFDAVILDLGLPDIQGFTLLKKLNRVSPATPVVILTALGDVSMAVRAMKDGAFDFVTKQTNAKDLIRAVRRAVAERDQNHSSGEWCERLGVKLGTSDAMQRVYEALQRAAVSRSNVFLAGEVGTGRSILGEQLHRLSERSDGPFFSLSCAESSAEDIERKLFGQVDFTRTRDNERMGILEMAQEGSVVLDRVELLSAQTQSALLEVLQQGEVRPIGGTVSSRFDVRLIATGPSEGARYSTLRDDLRFRLAGVAIEVPSLRERPEDIEPLARWMVENWCAARGRPLCRLTSEGVRLLKGKKWQGNIPELRKVLETALASVNSKEIGAGDLAAAIDASRSS